MATQTIDNPTLVKAASAAARLKAEISKAFIGSSETTDLLLIALLARGHALVEGVPGIAKTTLVKAFAEAAGCAFRRIQFTPDLLPSDITGTFVLDKPGGQFVLREGPIFSNIVLGDEINRAPAKTQSALLEAMQERQVTIEGVTRALDVPFMVLATQNPVDHEGTYPLPEAQVDRFAVRLRMGYPSLDAERDMLRRYSSQHGDGVRVERVLDASTISALQANVAEIHIDDQLIDYILGLARFTRSHRRVLLGVSPRGALQLVQLSKARALIQGRDFVLPDDVKLLVQPVFGHRLVLSADAELDGTRADAVLSEGLERTPYRG